MGFKLRVVFSGLLHYIENADPQEKFKLCIVLPQAPDHMAQIVAGPRTALTFRKRGVQKVDFGHRRMVLRLQKEDGAEPVFDFARPVFGRKVKGAIPIQLMPGVAADENPEVVSDRAGVANGVHAQILIEEGVFSLPQEDLDDPAELEIPGDGGRPPRRIFLSPRVLMEVDRLEAAELMLLPLGGEAEPEAVYRIDPGGSREATISIAHICSEALNVAVVEGQADADFVFHYRLLAGGRGLEGLPVPLIRKIPRRFKGANAESLDNAAEGLGGGCNCVSCQGLSRDFELDPVAESLEALPRPESLAESRYRPVISEVKRVGESEVKIFSEEQLEKAYQKTLHAYGARPDVTGVDVGYKYTDGEPTRQKAIRIHVREKVEPSGLEAVEMVPPMIEGVPTDVIEAVYRPQRELVSVAQRQQRLDPLQPGVSVGHRNVTAGTLGAIVFDRITGKPGILSNWHVLAGAFARPGDAILQPGLFDGGTFPRDVVAQLARSVLDERGDAAVALLDGQRSIRTEQLGSAAHLRGARRVRAEETLEKSGRTTGVTRGRVDGEGRYFIAYSVGRIGVDGFRIVTRKHGNPDNEEISASGDSGAVWYAPGTAEAVGLHFAGETDTRPGEEHALACHLPEVLDALQVSLVQEVQAHASAIARTASGQEGLSADLAELLTANREGFRALSQMLQRLLGEEARDDATILSPDSPRLEGKR